MSNQSSNRFWEFYLVRYLAGTLFAVLVVIILGANYSSKIDRALSFNTVEETAATLTVENIYNTIFKSSEIENKNFTSPYGMWSWPFILQSTEGKKEIGSFTFEAIIIFLLIGFLYMYLSSMPIYMLHIFRFILYPIFTWKFKWFWPYEFYKSSNNARIKHSKTVYISSYQHLREHGNAFGIILMEILFAYLLVIFEFSLWFIASWVSVGFLGWFLGHYLEFKMMENAKIQN